MNEPVVPQSPQAAPESTPAEIEAPETIEAPAPLIPVPVEHLPSPLDMPVEVFKGVLERRGTNRKVLMAWVRENLVDGVDFGRIKIGGKMSKPSLWKPGAEKICGMLNVFPMFPNLKEYEQAALMGAELKHIILRCDIVNEIGKVLSNGVGARSLTQDKGDLNKALKMALKSAHIDATLRLAGLSEVFTQDIEDMNLGDVKDTGGAGSGTTGGSGTSAPVKAKPAPSDFPFDEPTPHLTATAPKRAAPPPGFPAPIRKEEELLQYALRFETNAKDKGFTAEVLKTVAAKDVNGLYVYCAGCQGPCFKAKTATAISEFTCMGVSDGQGGYVYCPELKKDGSPSLDNKGKPWRLGWKRPKEGPGRWYTESWAYKSN